MTTPALTVTEMTGAPKFKVDYVTRATIIGGVVCHPKAKI